MSRYEEQRSIEATSACFYAISHPSTLPQFFRDVFRDTKLYYQGQDTVDLERGELVKIISYSRKMAIKMSGASLFLGLLVSLSLIGQCRAAQPWTPDNFDWSLIKVAPEDQWKGLYLNLTEVPQPMVAEHALFFAQGKAGVLGQHNVLFVPFAIGFAWQLLNVAVGIGSVATAIQGCVTTDKSPGSLAGCAFGIAGTILSIGTSYQAARGAGWFARASNTWSNSGLELIDLSVFSKRTEADYQNVHEYIMRDVLRSSFGEPEFLGYVSDEHTLSRRDDEHLHLAAPIFRINHPRHGLLDIASREHVDSTRFTISFANHGLEKRQTFQHERLSNHLMEARFDRTAMLADPARPHFNAAGGYAQVEQSVKCAAGKTWRAGSVLSAQFYDNSAKATFGFASLGIFPNRNTEKLARLGALAQCCLRSSMIIPQRRRLDLQVWAFSRTATPRKICRLSSLMACRL
ncbi:hypothetical protein V502_02528, partial [Pseudogymnoascus sp. VKM F-4520 (FW-2644)]